MTSQSGADGSASSYNMQASWEWLRGRLDTVAVASQLGDWLDEQLLALEEDFSEMVTERSRCLNLRAELGSDESRNPSDG